MWMVPVTWRMVIQILWGETRSYVWLIILVLFSSALGCCVEHSGSAEERLGPSTWLRRPKKPPLEIPKGARGGYHTQSAQH